MRRKLTPKTIDNLPPASGKRYEVRDELVTGLHIRVSATGGKVWYVGTRVNGRVRRIKLGTYPILSLADARGQARDLLRDIQLGRFTEREPEVARVPTLAEIIPQFIELYARPRNRDWKGTQSVLMKFSSLVERPINEIRRSDVVRVLDGIVAGGTPVRANRALAAIKKLMSWCVDRGVIEMSPVMALRPPAKETPRDRVLTDDELAACWQAGDAERFPFAQFLKLLVLTGQRRREVSGMCWSELDLERGLWTLPAARAKNATQHVVPLAPMAVELLRSMPRFLSSDLVFTTTSTTPISGFGRLKDRLDATMGVSDWRFHDLRRTAATNMAIMGVQPHIIEAVLNHKSGIVSGVAAIYNRHAYLDEKREALGLWADRVSSLAGDGRDDADRNKGDLLCVSLKSIPDRGAGELRSELAS